MDVESVKVRVEILLFACADVAARALFHATDHGVIQRVEGGVEMLSYEKPTRQI